MKRKKPGKRPPPKQFDMFPESAEQARNKAMKKVEDNAADWMPLCMSAFIAVASENQGRLVTGEDVRLLIRRRIREPHHHNVWGAVINNLRRDGLLERTDTFTRMRTRRSHARTTRLYRIPIKGESQCASPSNT